MNSLVYAKPVNSYDALVARIVVVAGDIQEMPGVFANVGQSLRRRCEGMVLISTIGIYRVKEDELNSKDEDIHNGVSNKREDCILNSNQISLSSAMSLKTSKTRQNEDLEYFQIQRALAPPLQEESSMAS
ncbi:hypothetical protein TNCV_3577201 [Trichonephila clavipes]|uniref:Uncharacterized protein n=1 Tax=Trichonephila clavipes TaxID=2585209 RepID=A0A8X6RK06_TRICX|nr:hypothetical protein TNCV_3577201 [Trichonephila clavipes]